MHCEHHTIDGTTFIVCGGRNKPKKCKFCSRTSELLCDWKIGDGETCDAPICKRCATHVGEDKDLCPPHARMFEQWKQRHPDHQLSAPPAQKELFEGDAA